MEIWRLSTAFDFHIQIQKTLDLFFGLFFFDCMKALPACQKKKKLDFSSVNLKDIKPQAELVSTHF